MSSETGPAGAPITGAARRSLSRTRSGRILAAIVAVAALAGCGGDERDQETVLDRADSGANLGAWAAPENSRPTPAQMLGARSELMAATDTDLPIAHFFYPWTSDPLEGGLEEQVLADGDVPMVSWNDADTERVASGAEDDRIRRIAGEFASLDGPVLMRWGWEMDADASDGGTGTRGGPEDYVAAWKHLRALFRDEGADNVEWVWCPNAYAFTEQADRDPLAFYPGDGDVDWLCADGYNWYPSRGQWKSFSSIFVNFYAWAQKKDKPILIGEFGVLEDPDQPRRKADWLLDMGTILKCDMPEVRGVVYFNEQRTNHEGITRDWRLTTSTASADAWRTVSTDEHFGGDQDIIRC